MRRPHSDSLAAVCGEDRLKAVTSGDVIARWGWLVDLSAGDGAEHKWGI